MLTTYNFMFLLILKVQQLNFKTVYLMLKKKKKKILDDCKQTKSWMRIKQNSLSVHHSLNKSIIYHQILPCLLEIKKKHQTSKDHTEFDSEMAMSLHITNVRKTVIFHLRNIGRIRKYIGQSTCQHAIHSLILSRLYYCNGLLSPCPNTHVIRLQRLQNWVSRLVFEVDRKQFPGTTFEILALPSC